MNQLFNLYAAASGTATVATSNGTLTWRYVSDGLTAGSGAVGQFNDGMYCVQLDANGGGVETVLPGDANLDGKVDINDLTIVLAHYNQTGATWAQGEFTGSGTVDINDLTIVLSNYGKTVSADSLAAVAEPSSLTLLGVLAAGLLGCAWRKRRIGV